MTKKLLFIEHGLVEGRHFQYQHDEKLEGNSVLFLNGSVKQGFEDSCDFVVMDCENDRIHSWATSKGIPVVDMKGKSMTDASVDTSAAADQGDAEKAEDVTDEGFGTSVDELVASQVAKAELEVANGAGDNSVPHISEIAIGEYIDPDGNKHERKKGPKLKDSFVEAIKKHGFEKFEFKKVE